MSRHALRVLLVLLLFGSMSAAALPTASACVTSDTSCPHYANDMYQSVNSPPDGDHWGEWNHPIIFGGFFNSHSNWQDRVDDAVAEINSEAITGNDFTFGTYDNVFVSGYNWGTVVTTNPCQHGHSGDLWDDPDVTQHTIVAVDNDGSFPSGGDAFTATCDFDQDGVIDHALTVIAGPDDIGSACWNSATASDFSCKDVPGVATHELLHATGFNGHWVAPGSGGILQSRS